MWKWWNEEDMKSKSQRQKRRDMTKRPKRVHDFYILQQTVSEKTDSNRRRFIASWATEVPVGDAVMQLAGLGRLWLASHVRSAIPQVSKPLEGGAAQAWRSSGGQPSAFFGTPSNHSQGREPVELEVNYASITHSCDAQQLTSKALKGRLIQQQRYSMLLRGLLNGAEGTSSTSLCKRPLWLI